jgi:hypothetical protein
LANLFYFELRALVAGSPRVFPRRLGCVYCQPIQPRHRIECMKDRWETPTLAVGKKRLDIIAMPTLDACKHLLFFTYVSVVVSMEPKRKGMGIQGAVPCDARVRGRRSRISDQSFLNCPLPRTVFPSTRQSVGTGSLRSPRPRGAEQGRITVGANQDLGTNFQNDSDPTPYMIRHTSPKRAFMVRGFEGACSKFREPEMDNMGH